MFTGASSSLLAKICGKELHSILSLLSHGQLILKRFRVFTCLLHDRCHATIAWNDAFTDCQKIQPFSCMNGPARWPWEVRFLVRCRGRMVFKLRQQPVVQVVFRIFRKTYCLLQGHQISCIFVLICKNPVTQKALSPVAVVRCWCYLEVSRMQAVSDEEYQFLISIKCSWNSLIRLFYFSRQIFNIKHGRFLHIIYVLSWFIMRIT